MTKARALVALFALVTAGALAQGQQRLTVEWIYSDDGENMTKLPEFTWTTTGDLLLFDGRKPEGERTLERIAGGSGQRRSVVDAPAALASLKALLGAKDAPAALRWPDSFDPAGTKALYILADDLFVLDLASSRFERITRTPEKERAARFSPDGHKVAFVRENDLYVCDLETRSEARLTRDGSATTLNGALSWVYWEEVFDHDEAGYWWSPDSGAIAFLRTDDSPVSEFFFPDFKPAVPNVIRQRYPVSGGPNPVVRLGIVDVASGRTVFVGSEEMPQEYILRVTWLPDSGRVAVQTTTRMQTRLDLYFAERASGHARRILTETDDAWVNQHELQFLDGGGRFVWSSERDGYTHLFLYEADGKLVAPLTPGEWSVRGPKGFDREALGSAFVDQARGYVYFTALEKSPVESHLYRVRLDGTGFERLTREDGVHVVSPSPDRSAFVDAFSSHCTPPALSLHGADGTRKAVLATSRTDVIAGLEWTCPELTTAPADDGFPLPVWLLKPRGFDAARKYPAILYVYGGPSAPVVRDSWDISFARNAPFAQILAREGYVVMSVDPRSATGISKKLENLVARNVWADLELADFLAGVRWLKSQPWVDPARVGIWGWSGGGTSTLLLMTRSSEFKAGIAVAPNTDWHYYDTKFSETYMKNPEDNPGGYENTSLIRRAKDLHGRLLLVHGSGDDNVHPQHTWAVVDELVMAGKPFDLMIYPMRKHTIDDRPARIHLFNKMLEFWKLYL
ncbi:MAG TPA: S9 family peptidase [Thermoanaerobaculaceae bacterium]|nr:S9 family peptidase [Thermoanaerobaculaceae bacterium]